MARKKNRTEDTGTEPNAWMVTFSDLITLLLTFFVMLISMSSMDTKIAKTFFSMFSGASGVLEFSEGGATIGEGESQMNRVDQLRDYLQSRDTPDDHLLKELLFQSQKRRLQMSEVLQGEDIEVRRSRQGLRVLFKNRVFFDAGTAELRPEALPLLDSLAPVIRYGRFVVSVEGHTDNTPLHSGRFRDNWELSLARAIQVVNYFTEVTDLSANRFRVGGFGSSRLLLPNDTPENRQKNRRIEIFLSRNY